MPQVVGSPFGRKANRYVVGTAGLSLSAPPSLTPTLGAEVLSNVEFTTNTASWEASDEGILTRRDFAAAPDIDPTGGADNLGLEVKQGTGANGGAIQSGTCVVGTWYRLSTRAYAPSANAVGRVAALSSGNLAGFVYANLDGGTRVAAEDAWQTLMSHGYAENTTVVAGLKCLGTTDDDVAYFDAVSLKPLTFTTCIGEAGLVPADYTAQVSLTIPLGGTAGMILSLDSPTNPQNFLLAYHNGVSATLLKYVAGAYTSVISDSATYAAGAVLKVVKAGTVVSLFYNGAQVGASATVEDAGVIGNTYAAHFSTLSTITFANFEVS